MSDSIERFSAFVDWKKRDKNKNGTQFNKFDLFDRVINLRLICGKNDEQSDFVLRSDYEVYIEDYVKNRIANVAVATDKRKGIIRRCGMKPSIKVQYRQVSGNTAIEIDIFIQNFFVLSSDGQTLMQFSSAEFPLRSVEVQMGYFGQWADKYSVEKDKVPTAEQYFSMEAPQGVQTLFCNVEYVQTDKLPPDSTLHIHGYVGSCYNEPVKEAIKSVSTETGKENEEDYGVKLRHGEVADFEFTSFQHYLFNNVTRRFLRRSVISTSKEKQKELASKVKIDKHGMMDYNTAKQYGVRVFISEGMQKHYKFAGKEVLYDEDGVQIKNNTYFNLALDGDTPMKCLNQFASRLPQEIRVAPCINGDYMLYTADESKVVRNLGESDSRWYTYDRDSTGYEADSDGNQMDYKKMGLAMFTWKQLSAYIHLSQKSIGIPDQKTIEDTTVKEAEVLCFVRKELPAVYNITSDAITTIVCPFFWFLSPFESVKFRSRYTLGGLVGYYADYTAKDTDFLILWQSVSFATVEDVNEVQMACTVLNPEKEALKK